MSCHCPEVSFSIYVKGQHFAHSGVTILVWVILRPYSYDLSAEQGTGLSRTRLSHWRVGRSRVTRTNEAQQRLTRPQQNHQYLNHRYAKGHLPQQFSPGLRQCRLSHGESVRPSYHTMDKVELCSRTSRTRKVRQRH